MWNCTVPWTASNPCYVDVAIFDRDEHLHSLFNEKYHKLCVNKNVWKVKKKQKQFFLRCNVQSYLKHRRQNKERYVCRIWSRDTSSASGPSIFAVCSDKRYGPTVSIYLKNEMILLSQINRLLIQKMKCGAYFLRSSSALPLSGNILLMAWKISHILSQFCVFMLILPLSFDAIFDVDARFVSSLFCVLIDDVGDGDDADVDGDVYGESVDHSNESCSFELSPFDDDGSHSSCVKSLSICSSTNAFTKSTSLMNGLSSKWKLSTLPWMPSCSSINSSVNSPSSSPKYGILCNSGSSSTMKFCRIGTQLHMVGRGLTSGSLRITTESTQKHWSLNFPLTFQLSKWKHLPSSMTIFGCHSTVDAFHSDASDSLNFSISALLKKHTHTSHLTECIRFAVTIKNRTYRFWTHNDLALTVRWSK